MKLRFGTKSIFLVTTVLAKSLVAFTWWVRRPVYFHTLDGKTYPMHGINAVVGCVMRTDHQNLSRLLLLDRYDLNRPSSPASGTGWTLLQHVIFKNSPECVEILLKHGADPNLHYGDTPMPLELARRTRDPTIITLLEQHGAVDSEAPK